MRKRYSGPWAPNPCIKAAILRPQQGHIHGESRLAMPAIAPEHELASIVDPILTEQRRAVDMRQQKAAASVWEDEGGRTAARWRV
jgi:hypothetical protein